MTCRFCHDAGERGEERIRAIEGYPVSTVEVGKSFKNRQLLMDERVGV
jgi:hypothetical protein